MWKSYNLPIPPKLSYLFLLLPKSWLKTTIFWLTSPREANLMKKTGAMLFPFYLKLVRQPLLPEYRNNSRNLDLLVDIILKINQSPDSRISHILIAGYASPDGDIRINSDFATLRAAALKSI